MGGKHQGPSPDCPDRERSTAKLAKNDSTYTAFGRGKAASYIVMDFDLTLSAVHVWNWLARSGPVSPDRIPRDLSIEEIYGGSARMKEIETFLQHVTSRGVQVIILTNNHRDVVAKCMQGAGFDRYVPDVIGREKKGCKGQIVAQLKEAFGTRSDKWVFVDDDPANISNVEQVNQGTVKTVMVDGRAGMKPKHLQAILTATASVA